MHTWRIMDVLKSYKDARRLADLRRYEILDTLPEEAFDDLARLASSICGTPIALISFVDGDRQWFKSRVGFAPTQTPIELSFCAHAIEGDDVFIVPDAQADPRFAANELVTGDPRIRFYAGAPLTSPSGHNLGTVCVIDRTVRELTEGQIEALRVLSRQAVAQIELRIHLAEIRRSEEALQIAHDELERRVADRTTGLARVIQVLRAEVAQRWAAEASLRHQATHDALTGLPNRALLHDRLERAIAAGAPGESQALLVLDLDRFREINDTFGHDYGDLVLKQMNPRLREALGGADTIARLGGDEFGLVLTATDEQQAVQAARQIIACLAAPIEVDGHRVEVGGTIGIALCPEHGRDPMTLLQRADVAMYVAKRSHAGHAVYDPAQSQRSPRRLAMIADLREAIDDDELILHYQPKVDLKTMRPAGAEALVRWRHPIQGLLPPGEFIPLAELTGLIKPLDLWTLAAATRQGQAWRQQGLDVEIAVNLGTESLQNPELTAILARLLARAAMPPSRLTLEITESAMMANPALAMQTLCEIHDLGVRLAIDDFGTGYSSLTYLKGLPVDSVKIDQSFVRNMALDQMDVCIVRSVIDMGHNLGLQVVAEGVEDRETVDLLRGLGCDYAQGYHISHPLAPANFASWTEERTELMAYSRVGHAPMAWWYGL